MTDEQHIASMVVHVLPERASEALGRLQALAGLEVEVSDPSGKTVVTLEADDEAQLLSTIEEVNAVDGVLAANLVYHYSETATLLDEEIDDENHAS